MATARARALLAVILGALPLVAAVAPGPSARADGGADPVRILVVGDSMTQGSTGDWTWRYRLAKDLDSAGVGYDFVGPRTTLFGLADSSYDTDTTYADPDFDSAHFARWGGSFKRILAATAPSEQDTIGWAVSTYQPDVVIEALGINDLLYYTNPETTVDRTQEFVDEVREAKPDTAVVVSTVARIDPAGTDDDSRYNAGLRQSAPAWSTTPSPVVVADPAAAWVGGPTDTWDNTHPNARGEVKFAAAEADALAALGIGTPPARPLPAVPLGPTVPATLAVVPGDGQASLTWSAPPGANLEYVSMRDATAGEPWHQLPYGISGDGWTSTGLTNNHRYQFRLQSAKGTAESDLLSNLVSVTPQPDPPVAVGGLTATPADHGVAIQWASQSDAGDFLVEWCRDGTTSGCGTRTVTAPSADLTGLLAGATYRVTVTARNTGGSATPVSVTATPTGAAPGAPAIGSVRSRSGHRVQVSFTSVRSATRYEVQMRRRMSTSWTRLGFTTSTSFTTGAQRVGQVLHLRVRAWDDLIAGGTSRQRQLTVH